ncbi:MAG: hypothetical protein GY710_17265 [Desulfobacteraceae bacterium]|nr:hypothetical protein [Desulfobacteraceae bacterium]
MAYRFRIIQPLVELANSYEQTLDRTGYSSININSREYVWPEYKGGLYLNVEKAPVATYKTAPIERKAIKRDQSLQVSRCTVSAGDPDGTLASQMANNPDLLKRATVIVRRTYMDLDQNDPSAYRTIFRGSITNWYMTESGNFSMEVSDRWMDWSLPVTRRRYNKRCEFPFKGSRCGYQGSETFCDKSKTNCEAIGNENNFGGFKEVPFLRFAGIFYS